MTETLSLQEEEFWKKLIEKYLEPIEPTEEEKVQNNQMHSTSHFLVIIIIDHI